MSGGSGFRGMTVDIVNVLGTSVDTDGFQSATFDADGEEGSPAYQVRYIHGVCSRPLDPVVDQSTGAPDPTRACSALMMLEGGHGHFVHLDDPRSVAALPNVQPGETILHSDFGSFQRHAEDGSISDSTTTTGGGSDGQSVFQRVAPDHFQRIAPWGKETLDATGFRWAHVGGARFSLGYAGGLVPGLSNYARIQADTIELNGSAVTIGPTSAVHQPVAQALPLVEILQNLQAVHQAVLTMITAMGLVPPNPASGAAIAGIALTSTPLITAAVQTAQASVAAALETISTQTAIG